jgi:hypothetical protein
MTHPVADVKSGQIQAQTEAQPHIESQPQTPAHKSLVFMTFLAESLFERALGESI